MFLKLAVLKKAGRNLEKYLRGTSFLLHLQSVRLKFKKKQIFHNYFSRVYQNLPSLCMWNNKKPNNPICWSFWIFLSSSPFKFSNFRSTSFLGTPPSGCFSEYMPECYAQKNSSNFLNNLCVFKIISTRYKLTFPLVPISNKFASFLFEKQYALIYQVVVSFWVRNNKKYLKIDIFLDHASTLPIQVSATIT